MDVRVRQPETIQWGKLGDLEDGKHLIQPSEGWRLQTHAYGARGDAPLGPAPRLDRKSVV